jgi:hypothetical protein
MAGGTETPTSVTYRDAKRAGLSVSNPAPKVQMMTLYPNPATGNIIKLKVPASWTNFSAKVYDAGGKIVAENTNQGSFSVAGFASGKYFVIAESGASIAFAQFVK